MRFLSTLFFLSAFSTLPAFARMNQLVSRTNNDHPAIARRQHHPMRTPLTDICASVDLSVLPKISVAGLLEASISVEVDICLCVTVVPLFVKTDLRIKDYVNIVGEIGAITAIQDIVRLLDNLVDWSSLLIERLTDQSGRRQTDLFIPSPLDSKGFRGKRL